ncbi:GTP-binding protein [Persephonella atlantica]|uniref:GTP-binding protein n=1 Tax=Persephonella atlantica TaxID=2699429 RepID=A0ABS1GFQ5_9AQUI|nr:GTP-binding protein [Persephonella atlantica]MBK3331756.1 GTP-binding protein [Persephonella atlantica]
MIKILVTGHFSAGKTEFIKSLSENPLLTEVNITSSGEKSVKEKTTVAMDYGKVKIDDKTVHLFGTPGQERFDFMLDVLGRHHHGAVVILDSTDLEGIKKSEKFIEHCRKEGRPFVIACNKQDRKNAKSVRYISDMFNLPEGIFVPLNAKDRKSCLYVLNRILHFITVYSRAA